MALIVFHRGEQPGQRHRRIRRPIAIVATVQRANGTVNGDIQSNVAAIALYAGAGFMPIARRSHYYPPVAPDLAREDALVMRLALAPRWSPAPAPAE